MPGSRSDPRQAVIPAGAIHAEGEVTDRMVIVGISEEANLLERLALLKPDDSPRYQRAS